MYINDVMKLWEIETLGLATVYLLINICNYFGSNIVQFKVLDIVFMFRYNFVTGKISACISNKCIISTLTDVINPLQIMYTVMQGKRPDTSEEYLPLDVPHRELMKSLMESSWAQNPDERPSFSSQFHICAVRWEVGKHFLRPVVLYFLLLS